VVLHRPLMARVLFLADQFSDAARTRHDRHPGGAELTDAAALAACPWPVTTRRFSEFSPGESKGFDVLVVANSQSATPAQLAEIAGTGRHIAFEHDLRVCRWRGNFPRTVDPAHRCFQRCWCPHPESRALFASAAGVIFLTAYQERIYRANPFFACGASRVLGSSLFEGASLEQAERASPAARAGTCVFASPHRIKGFEAALGYCRERGIEPALIRGLAPADVLALFARSERFVYLPIGPEWAGRMVVEARLLGCEVVLNENVGVSGEPFWRGSRPQAFDFIANGPRRFWRQVEELLNAERAEIAESPTTIQQKIADGLLSGLRRLPPWLMPADARVPQAVTFAAW
jgi:hypothetical protein